MNDFGMPTLLKAGLGPLVQQSNAATCSYPALTWGEVPINGLPRQHIHPKLVAFGWRSVDDSFAGMTADGSLAFVVSMEGELWVGTRADPGDRFVDIAVSREHRKLCVLSAKGQVRLLDPEVTACPRAPPDLGTLTLDVLNTTKV